MPAAVAVRPVESATYPDVSAVRDDLTSQASGVGLWVLGDANWALGIECGGPPGDRTRDTLIKSQVLYH